MKMNIEYVNEEETLKRRGSGGLSNHLRGRISNQLFEIVEMGVGKTLTTVTWK